MLKVRQAKTDRQDTNSKTETASETQYNITPLRFSRQDKRAIRCTLYRLSLLTAELAMGVDIETLKPGDGASFPKPGNKVICHYVLTLTNGTKVDSSRDRGQPFSFNLGRGEVSWEAGSLMARREILTVLSGHCWLGRWGCQDV